MRTLVLPVSALLLSGLLVGCGDDGGGPTSAGLTCGDGTTQMGSVCVADEHACPTGSHDESGVCVPDTPGLSCGDGTRELSGECVPSEPVTACRQGTHEDDGQCLPDDAGVVCGPGTHDDGGRCVPDSTGLTCAVGTHEESGACVPDYPEIRCAAGTHQEGAQCVPDYDEIVCAEGTHEEDGACVPDYPQITCGGGTEAIDGVCTVTDTGPTCGLGTVEEGGECVLAEPPIDCGYGTVQIGDECVSLTEQWVHLPFPEGASVTLGQGFHGYFTHSGSQVYALDFNVPEGTEVAAARSGVVVRVREDSNNGCGNGSCAADANYVVVDHGDGTYGRYWHLQQDGVLVDAGDTVCQGQVIALSGATGFATGPHLHFEIADTLRYTIPLRIEELRDNPAGGLPSSGDTMVSANTEPASCAPVTPSSCPIDTFAHIGVVLDPDQPCSELHVPPVMLYVPTNT